MKHLLRIAGFLLLGAVLGLLWGHFAGNQAGMHDLSPWLLAITFIVFFLWHLTRGVILIQRGHFTRAEKYYRNLLSRSRPGTRTHAINVYNLASVLAWNGLHEESSALLKELNVSLLPEHLLPFHHYIVAVNHAFGDGNLEEAYRHARLSASPVNRAGHLIAAYAADKLGRTTEADTHFRAYQNQQEMPRLFMLRKSSLVIFPSALRRAATEFLLGHFLMTRGRTGEATAHLQASVSTGINCIYTRCGRDLLASL